MLSRSMPRCSEADVQCQKELRRCVEGAACSSAAGRDGPEVGRSGGAKLGGGALSDPAPLPDIHVAPSAALKEQFDSSPAPSSAARHHISCQKPFQLAVVCRLTSTGPRASSPSRLPVCSTTPAAPQPRQTTSAPTAHCHTANPYRHRLSTILRPRTVRSLRPHSLQTRASQLSHANSSAAGW
jgi:hypothetical protein